MSFPASLDDTLSLLQTWASNFQRNATASLTNLTPKDVIRIIIVVGAYVLILRPQLLRLSARSQARQHAEREPPSTDDGQAVGISALDPDSDSDDAKGNARTGEWGRRARLPASGPSSGRRWRTAARRTTATRRLGSFWWIDAFFALLGLLSLIPSTL